MKKLILSTMILALLLLSFVSASPEPSIGFKVTNWIENNIPSVSFSINSDYKSFTRYNPNFDTCYYYTGVCSSNNKVAVAKNLCTLDGVNKYTTIKTEDQKLAERFCTTSTTTPKTGDGKLGSVCNTASDCGLTCQGYSSTTCSPVCLYDPLNEARICIKGDGVKPGADNTIYKSYYATACIKNTECETSQTCENGMCTAPNYDSGNLKPVTKTDICSIVNCDTKCTDGTRVGSCSSTKIGEYCEPLDAKQDNARLIGWSAICGCPDGQRPDFNGRTCCTAPNCLNCEAGEIQTKACPGGDEIIVSTCSDTGFWTSTANTCKVNDDKSFSATPIFILIAIVIIVLIALLTWLVVRKK